ncbi:MAG: MFS transporter [Gracilibacteraceae bacterium]|nr:MFS transporter [Gracilibacteraceae bacterium]
MNAFQEAPKSKKMITLVGIYLGILASLVQSSTLSTILPIASMEIGGMEIYPLASVVGGILSVVAMPLYGFLGAKNPALKRTLVLISLITGVIVLFTRAMAASMMVIVVMSFFYGLVSAGIYVICYSMIRDMFNQVQAGVYLGLVGTMASIGMLVGPVLTGFLITYVGWRVVCHIIWIGLAISAVLIFMGVKVTKEQVENLAIKINFDAAGTIILAVFLACLILPLSLGNNFLPFGSPVNSGMLAVAVISLIALIMVIRKKGGNAIIPATVLKDKTTLLLSLLNLLLNFSSMAIFFFIPSYVIYILGQSALYATISSAMLAVMGVFIGPILGKAIAKAGNARTVLTSATIVRIVVTLGFILLLKPSTSIYVVWALMFIAGYYNSTQSVTFSTAPQIQVRPDIRLQSNSVIQMSQNIGSSIGMTIYTIILMSPTLGLANGMPVALWVATAAAAIALVLGLMLKKLEIA